MSKTLKLLVIISLCLNAFLLSLIAGKALQQKTKTPNQTPLVSLLEQSSLPEAKRDEFVAKLQGLMKRKTAGEHRKIRKEKISSILTAEPFDAAAYRMQLEERFLKSKLHKVDMIDVMVEIAAALSPSERKQMANILMRPRPKKRVRH